ncbi:thioesterase domain-containing protein [Micromonospora sp. CPCC 205539]|uniref:thioesterase domain-containing protein n=1 Tax=Micromonospora sp. CPCC 205539 TaxID=3122408 RepID=UPI002FF1991B
MARTIVLQQVGDGRAGCLLTVEFPGDSTGAGLAATLAAAESATPPDGRHQVWRLDPVTSVELDGGLPDHATLAGAAAAEFLRHRPAGAGPLTVVGYCSAALFAGHLTRALAAAGSPPDALVLVAATVPDERTAWREHATLLRKLTGEPAPTPPAGPADPHVIVHRWRAELTGHARAFVDAQGFPPAEAETAAQEIAGRYLAWLWFLLDAARAGEARVSCPVTVLADDAEAIARLPHRPATAAGQPAPGPTTARQHSAAGRGAGADDGGTA